MLSIMLLKIFVLGPIDNNSILLTSEKTKESILIDPTLKSFENISKYLKDNNYTLKKILITHSHWDHIAECKQFKDEFNPDVYVHEKDAPNLIKPGSDGLFKSSRIKGVNPDVLLKGGEKITLDNIEIEVIHTPGHSPGGVCYYIPKENLLISGDTLFKGSFGRVDFPTANPEDMIKSLQKLSKLPQNTKVIPGHGSTTTIEKESWLKDPTDFLSG